MATNTGMRMRLIIGAGILLLVAAITYLLPQVYQFTRNTKETPALKRFEYVQIHMAMPVKLTVWTDDQDHAEEVCQAAFERIATLERIYSDYDEFSETSRFNRLKIGEQSIFRRELAELLYFCRDLNQKSNGFFDPTAGETIQLWRTARKEKALPSNELIRQSLDRRGFHQFEINTVEADIADIESSFADNESNINRFIGFESLPGTDRTLVATLKRIGPAKLDFGSVAKGYIGDEVIRLFKHRDIPIACFEAGGDIVCGDAPPDAAGWAVTTPRNKTLSISNSAVAISGDTEQALELNGRRYSHVIDMRTGKGITTRRMAVVIAKRGAESDALATVGCAMETEAFQKLINSVEGAQGWSFIYD